jgi:hypothetical protein
MTKEGMFNTQETFGNHTITSHFNSTKRSFATKSVQPHDK